MTTTNTTQKKKITLKLEPLTCPSCVASIEKTLGRKDGVISAEVGFNSSKVKAEIDSDQIAANEVAQLIEELGYEVKNIRK